MFHIPIIGSINSQAGVGFSPTSIPTLRNWFRANSGASSSAWNDLKSGSNLAQTSPGNQPTLNSSDNRFNNQPAFSFDGVASPNSDYLFASTAADWTYLHDGSGMTVYIVVNVDTDAAQSVILDTCNAQSSNVGFTLDHQGGASDYWRFLVTNGTGVVVNANTGASTAVAPKFARLCLRYEEGRGGNEYDLRLDGTSVASGNSSNAPSASAPHAALTVGRRATTDDLPFDGSIAEIICYDSYLDDADVDLIDDYAEARYGLYTPYRLPTPRHWWDPAINVTHITGNVTDMNDLVSTLHVTQATSADRPSLTTINGRTATQHTVTGEWLEGTIPASIAQPFAIWFVVEIGSSADVQFWYSADGASTADMYLALNTHFGGWYAQCGVTFIQGGAAGGAMVGPYAACAVFDGTSGAIYANNNFATPVVTGNAGFAALSGTFRIGAQISPTSQPSRSKQGACVISSGVPSTDDLRGMADYFERMYPGLTIVQP